MKNKHQKTRQGQKANKKQGFFKVLFTVLMTRGNDAETANRRAFHQVFMEGGNGEYHPIKHPRMSYAKQNRLAKKRRRARA